MRDWECDRELENYPDKDKAMDIARQLVETEPGMNYKVMLGGGYPAFIPCEDEEVSLNLKLINVSDIF